MKEIIPDFLTHYYLPDKKPFLTLSDLEGDKLNEVLTELRLKAQKGESLRGFASWYVDERKKTEVFLRNEFIKKGGKPQRKFPIYFVLGKSEVQKGLSSGTKELIIDLKTVPKEFLSFTYPDSMATMVLMNDDEFRKPYHGKIFTFSEIIEVVREHGFPKDEGAKTSKFIYPNYIEAQVWCDLNISE